MRYLITGGAGFIGSHLVDALTTRGDDVLVLDDLSTGRLENLDELYGDPGRLADRDGDGDGPPTRRFSSNHSRPGAVEFVQGSVTDEALVDDCMSSVDLCMHLASAVGVQLVVRQPLESLLRNVRGCDIVICAAARHRRRLLFTSTSEIYGKLSGDSLPETADRILGSPFQSRWSYSTAKAFGEILAASFHRQEGAETVVARLFNTVGPRQTGAYGMVLPRFVRQALAGDDLTVYGTGTQSRCFTHVLDTVHALVLLSDAEGATGRVFNVGAPRAVSVIELAGTVIERAGSESKIKLVRYEDAYGPGFEELGRRVPDTSALERLTGWTPSRTVEETVDDVIAYEQSEARGAEEEGAPGSEARETHGVLGVAG
jgi:UDP-glucose 4-epimerase